MIRATIHYARKHLSRLLADVQHGETVVILKGETPVARLVAIDAVPRTRPNVGEVTTSGVRWSEDAFRPLTDSELREWGL